MIATSEKEQIEHSHCNLPTGLLIEHALARKEGILAGNKALRVETGKRTGRSPKDRFIVRDELTNDTVEWNTTNQAIDTAIFNKLWQRAELFLDEREHFVSELCVGADKQYTIPVVVKTELAWHNLFVNNLFIKPDSPFTPNIKHWTLISTPNLHTDPEKDGVNSDGCVIINFSQKKVLVTGISYAGEMKKAMFSVMNYILPELNILPMHCAANQSKSGDTALFFGLSGTGKTTLSSDPDRFLIGDDEHGWSTTGIFNFEGGCYAKCIDLSEEREPVIWQAIKYGAIMENVVLNSGDNQPKYEDSTLTENTRAAYPLSHIEKRVMENAGRHPSSVVFLTCDLYGVLPPVAKLNLHQAAYYFLSGYTALVGSTELGGDKGIRPVFSTCFGAPFFPRSADVYAKLLQKRIEETNCDVYLVNTGWTGGPIGKGGKRFSIPTTRTIINSILTGELKLQPQDNLPGFNLSIPLHLPGVDPTLLDPRKSWSSESSFDAVTNELIDQFQSNFLKFTVADDIVKSGPQFLD